MRIFTAIYERAFGADGDVSIRMFILDQLVQKAALLRDQPHPFLVPLVERAQQRFRRRIAAIPSPDACARLRAIIASQNRFLDCSARVNRRLAEISKETTSTPRRRKTASPEDEWRKQ